MDTSFRIKLIIGIYWGKVLICHIYPFWIADFGFWIKTQKQIQIQTRKTFSPQSRQGRNPPKPTLRNHGRADATRDQNIGETENI